MPQLTWLDRRGVIRRTTLGATIVFGSTLAACSNSSDLAPGASSRIGFTSSSTLGASAATVPITSGTHTLDLTQATLTVARLELKRVETNACSGDDALADGGGDDTHTTTTGVEDCAELEVGPATVDLPLTGGMVTLPANALPAGTFRELEIRVSQVELKGTFDGKAFDVTLPVNVHDEIEFDTPLVVTDGAPTSITINVPVGNWLTNADGSLIDPSTIASNTTLLDLVRSRIRASLHAFEDEDHDGHDDHGEHSHG
ncbi:MAG TPA: hypothetical protein VLN49_04640 [Gemmatimonadaceae bacterium]|nr:hypothetical protein [Gemmatimonadaceae bacterium]